MTLQSMSEECQDYKSKIWIKEPEVQMEIQALQKMPANDHRILFTDALDCISEWTVNLSIRNVFAGKGTETHKNSASGVVIGEIISISQRMSRWRKHKHSEEEKYVKQEIHTSIYEKKTSEITTWYWLGLNDNFKRNLEKIGAPKMEKSYREVWGASDLKLKIIGAIYSDVSFQDKTGEVKAYIGHGLF